MLSGRGVAWLLTIVVLLLGTTIHAASSGAGIGREEQSVAGMPSGPGGCDPGHLATMLRCQVGCVGIAAALVTVPALSFPQPSTGWMPTGNVRGSGRELAPDLPPPKRGDMA